MGVSRELWMAPLSRGIVSAVGGRAYSTVLRPQHISSTTSKCGAMSVTQILSARSTFRSPVSWNTTSIANTSTSRLVHQLSRNTSALSKSSLLPKILKRPGPQLCLEARQFHVSSFVRYDRLQSLEEAANRDRDNANTQAIFMQVKHPFRAFNLT